MSSSLPSIQKFLPVLIVVCSLWQFFLAFQIDPDTAAFFYRNLLHLSKEGTRPQRQPRDRRHIYVRYDDAGISPIPGSARSHHLPRAVPSRRTIPRSLAEDWGFHLSQRGNTTTKSFVGKTRFKDFNWKHDYATDHRTLYLANPSVLPLHNTLSTSKNDPDWLSKEDLHALTGGDPTVRYLATFRAYTGCNCFGADPQRRLWKAGELVTYYGLALLDENLDLINGTDTLVDFNIGPGYGQYWMQIVGDCRLFLLRGGIYALCNEKMLRLQIRRTTASGSTARSKMAGTGPDERLPYVYPNIYGDGLEVMLLFSRHRWAGKDIGGKNFNVFSSPSTSGNSTGPRDYYLQVYPSQPHWYHRLNVPPNTVESLPGIYKQDEDYQWNDTLPDPSFDTADVSRSLPTCDDDDVNNCTNPRMAPFWGDKDRGSACCVALNLEGHGPVMVGINHSKFHQQHPGWSRYGDVANHKINQYVSRFVAYQSQKPFGIVARSGWFCLGFADEDEPGGNSLAGRNTRHRLELFNETYNCPYIHFVSGFSEVVGDPSKAIIAYGVNDCHPRMFMVYKKDIADRLLGQW